MKMDVALLNAGCSTFDPIGIGLFGAFGVMFALHSATAREANRIPDLFE